MSIDKKDVKRAAFLSRLELDEKDLGIYSEQLAAILSYISKLKEINTDNTAPTSHPLTTLKNVFRKDALKNSLAVEEVLKNAPSKEGDFFKVPQVIESFGKSSGLYPVLRQAQHGSEHGERSRTKRSRRIEGK